MTETTSLPAYSTEDTAQSTYPAIAKLFLASFLALYFELLVVRYISTELQVFTTLKNLPLIASFFGIGIGMIRGKAFLKVKRLFPVVGFVLFMLALIGHRIPQPKLSWEYNVGVTGTGSYFLSLVIYLVEVLGVLWLIVLFFVVLGMLVGEYFSRTAPLRAYGINLAGSLAGIMIFTLLSFLSTPPAIWLAVGFLLLATFFWRHWFALAVFAVIVGVTAIPQSVSYWSPYHRIDVSEVRAPGSQELLGYSLQYNHVWYQTIVNLSPEYLRSKPDNRLALEIGNYYDLPYKFANSPKNVLVVGAGTGNDVASALRHGADHVDAVEIDPMILGMGKKYHPERPYDSPKVTTVVNDARAYFQKCDRKYDLIIFGFLDSSTLLSGSSSLRLDNYVYTRESFEAARKLLAPDGTLILTFAVTRGYVADRLFVTLTDAFGTEPRAFSTVAKVYGIVFVEGAGRNNAPANEKSEVTAELERSSRGAVVATDSWPFLYLDARRIPASLCIALLVFVGSLWFWQSDNVQRELPPNSVQFFLLGAGFLLLETRAVTQLSLLFGSTWIVVAVVVASFLVLAIAANAFTMRFGAHVGLCYGALIFLIILSMLVPYSLFEGLPIPLKLLAATLESGLPVFFSGIVFSTEFKRAIAPSASLGINMLGAVVGGVLENSVMIGGVVLVGTLALLAYGGAWLSWNRQRAQPKAMNELKQASL